MKLLEDFFSTKIINTLGNSLFSDDIKNLVISMHLRLGLVDKALWSFSTEKHGVSNPEISTAMFQIPVSIKSRVFNPCVSNSGILNSGFQIPVPIKSRCQSNVGVHQIPAFKSRWESNFGVSILGLIEFWLSNPEVKRSLEINQLKWG